MVCGGIILILFGKFYLNIILNFIFKLLKKDYLFIVTSIYIDIIISLSSINKIIYIIIYILPNDLLPDNFSSNSSQLKHKSKLPFFNEAN